MTQSRRMLVLRAVVEDYIRSQEPIGSSALTKTHDLGVSSATVRNDMAALEDEGYLIQPHTSAGRIPTEKGYRHRGAAVAGAAPRHRHVPRRFGQSAGHAAAGRPPALADHRTGGGRRLAGAVEGDGAACGDRHGRRERAARRRDHRYRARRPAPFARRRAARAGPAGAVHPFGERRMRVGVALRERGDGAGDGLAPRLPQPAHPG